MTTYLLSPFSNNYLGNAMFDGPTGTLRDLMAERGISMCTVDLGDIRSADRILFYDLNRELLLKCLAAGVTPDRLVLFLFEPEVTRPDQYNPRVWQHFGTIFTSRDDLVDNVRFFKLKWPQIMRRLSSLPGFEERKLAAMINSNKFSYVDGEGFTYRRKAIRFFDSVDDFDLYGPNWNDNALTRQQAIYALKQALISKTTRNGSKLTLWRAGSTALLSPKMIASYFRDILGGWRPFRSYIGTVPDKDETLSHYRFCLCYENQFNRPGYMTEKIFDCFVSGTIPIYLGATNVDEYVPRSAFIWMKDIPDFSALHTFMKSMTSAEFNKMQRAGQEFLDSEAFGAWTPKGSFNDIIAKLLWDTPAVGANLVFACESGPREAAGCL
ncbi:MAG: glycosyltransferase family 10 [Armatimonadota bacterium]|nr:glycosyltransferase family 10 [Armatimonadota bacterium]